MSGAATHRSEYHVLIRRLFQSHSAVALVAGPGQRTGDICEGIAAELAASGRRVVLVRVDALLAMNPLPIPDESACAPGRAPNIWLWPSTAGAQVEFFKASAPALAAGDWLDSLRRNFDSVLLDCPAVDTVAGGAEVASKADAAVLAVEAGRAPKQQIQRCQRALQSSGVKLAGCILIGRR
ncbi:MAG: hypothetical protein WA655_00590 [Candidatus Korobacteraceae bacterium]